MDIDGDGRLSFIELAHGLHVPDLRLPSKTLIKGGQFKKPKPQPASRGIRPAPSAPSASPHE